MRRVLYSGAMSLDGYIAGPNGEHDWIVTDPDVDFAAMMAQYDTFLIGRKTYETMRRMSGETPPTPGITSIVCSKTLKSSDVPGVAVSPDAVSLVTDLRARPGKDIALFGGGELFRSLLAAGLVDGIGVSLMPVLLGGGVPFLPPPADRASLRLTKHRHYGNSGIVGLWYDVVRP